MGLIKDNKRDGMHYEASAPKLPSKQGIRIISEMSTFSILWFVAKKHRVGLLALLAVVGFTYDSLIPFAAHELFSLLLN